MISTDPAPRTVRDLWFAEAVDGGRVLANALAASGGAHSLLSELRTLTRATGQVVDERAIEAVADLLGQLDVGHLIVAGWRTYTRLTAGADRTLAKPGSEEAVELATHHIIATHELPVDVFVDDTKVATLHFGHEIDFELNAIVAVIRHGDLVGLRAGRCAATLTFTLDDAEVACTHASLDLPYLIQLRPGIPLHTHRPTRAGTGVGWHPTLLGR